METWRIIGGAAAGCGGLLLVLVAMAQARDSVVHGRATRLDTPNQRVARSAAFGLTVVTVMVLLCLTVLPMLVVWSVAAAVWLLMLTVLVLS